MFCGWVEHEEIHWQIWPCIPGLNKDCVYVVIITSHVVSHRVSNSLQRLGVYEHIFIWGLTVTKWMDFVAFTSLNYLWWLCLQDVFLLYETDILPTGSMRVHEHVCGWKSLGSYACHSLCWNHGSSCVNQGALSYWYDTGREDLLGEAYRVPKFQINPFKIWRDMILCMWCIHSCHEWAQWVSSWVSFLA